MTLDTKTIKKTRVVNIRFESGDIYIGRSKQGFHYGNPFAIRASSVTSIKASGRYESMKSCHDWLKGTDHITVEPERRQWILDHIESLRGKSLGCFCKPKPCHGDVFRVLLGEISLEEALGPNPKDLKDEHQITLF